MSKKAELAIASAAEFSILLGLWMGFASSSNIHEFSIGLVVALVATIADYIVKEEGLAHFRPKLSWLMFMFVEPWYASRDSAIAIRELLRAALGKPSKAKFKTQPFEHGGDDQESSARRTLLTAYMTIPPNSIVVGIDRKHGQVLIHELSPSETPVVAERLGVEP